MWTTKDKYGTKIKIMKGQYVDWFGIDPSTISRDYDTPMKEALAKWGPEPQNTYWTDGGVSIRPADPHNMVLWDETKEYDMRHLYEVYIVDPEDDKLMDSHRLIAKSGSSAKIKALSKAGLADDVDVDDLDVIVIQLGDVRDKKEIQEVKILKD